MKYLAFVFETDASLRIKICFQAQNDRIQVSIFAKNSKFAIFQNRITHNKYIQNKQVQTVHYHFLKSKRKNESRKLDLFLRVISNELLISFCPKKQQTTYIHVDYASRILNKQLHIQKFEFSALVILPQQKIRIISNITLPEYSKYIQLII